MPLAAREGDHVEHTHALEGLLTGLAVGAIVGAVAVLTCGVGLAVIATAASVGAGLGQGLGHMFKSYDEAIDTGASKVQIGGQWAARAVADTMDKHAGQRIAQGSRRVAIENFPAARIDDKTECDGKIAEGCANVEIGLEPGTFVEIGHEVPVWLEIGVQVLGLVGMVGELAMAEEAVTAVAEAEEAATAATEAEEAATAANEVEEGLAAEGEAPTLGETPEGEGVPNAEEPAPNEEPASNSEGEPQPGESSSPPEEKCDTLSHPVDVVSGAVVDAGTDLTLPGPVPVVWRRTYSSLRAMESSALGEGGWTHSFDQWIAEEPGVIRLREADGRDIYFKKILPGESTFHRRERLTLTSDPNGGYTIHSLQSRLTRKFTPLFEGQRAVLRNVADAHGNSIELYYEQGRLTGIVDTAERHVVVQNDPLGRVSRVEIIARGAVQQCVGYEYHPSGELACVVDAAGHTERFEYDDDHRMVAAQIRNGVSFRYEYEEPSGRCVRTWGDGGLYTYEFRFDIEGRKTIVSCSEKPAVYEWNPAGVVERISTLDGKTYSVRRYDRDLYLIAEGPTESALTRHEYDARGNRVRTIDPAGNVTTWDYAGDLACRRTSPDGLVTELIRNERGALSEVIHPSGLRDSLEHDVHGRLTAVRRGDAVLLQFEHDREHNVIGERDVRGAITRYEYDALGRALARTDALGRVTRVEYDALGRPVTVLSPDGGVRRAAYDALGNVARTEDALGQVTTLEYSGTGVLTRLVQPDGEAWTLSYDGKERLRQIENPHGERYSFEYDAAGRVRKEHTFDGRTLRYRYSNAGHLARIDYPDQTFRAFERDPLGNVIEETSRDASIELKRDRLGRLERATLHESSGRVVTELKRDALGRVVVETQNGRAIRYAYDQQGRRVERSLPDGSTTRYEHDPLGALIAVEHDGQRVAIQRDSLGREASRRAADGRFEIQSAYDEMDRLIERRTASAQELRTKRTWKYDLLGRVREIGDDRWGTTSYEYDSVGQLIEAKRGSYHEVFQYDAVGSLRNILGDLTQAAQARPWDTEEGNRLTRTDKARYEYDARGRRVKKIALVDAPEGGERADSVTEYVWDERDRLREVKKPTGERVLFTYDAFGRRVRKEILPGEHYGQHRVVEFLWDGNELAADIDNQRGSRVFVHEPGTFIPMLQAEQGEVFAVVNDHLGMPKELVDQDGRVAWSAAHCAWGTVVEEYRDPSVRRKMAVESPFRLLGQYADEETGLCYTRYRYFDAEVGRWCSPDPLGWRGGPNIYGYTGTPTISVDPLGLECQKGPPPNDGVAKPHGGEAHNTAIDEEIANLKNDPEVTNIRKNQQQVDVDGNKVGTNRPDLQYDKNGVHHCVEYDTIPSNGIKHGEVITGNDPAANVRLEDVLR
jgi:RHS repeat-associated protein